MRWATLIANRNPARGIEYYLQPVRDLRRWIGIPTDVYVDLSDAANVSSDLKCRQISVESIFRLFFHGDVVEHEYDSLVIGPLRRMGRTWPILACWLAKYWIVRDVAACTNDDLVCWLDAGHAVTYYADGMYDRYRDVIRGQLYGGDGKENLRRLEDFVRENTSPVLVIGSPDVDCGLDHVEAWSRMAIYGCFFAVRRDYVETMFDIVVREWARIVSSCRIATDESLLYLGVKRHSWKLKDWRDFFRRLYGWTKGVD